MARIFISYRRSDSAGAYVASMLRDAFEEHFGTDSVFLDIDAIPLGVDYRQDIANAVGRCDVLLVIIGDYWLQVFELKGNEAGENTPDYVR